jgi:hypothetical protein
MRSSGASVLAYVVSAMGSNDSRDGRPQEDIPQVVHIKERDLEWKSLLREERLFASIYLSHIYVAVQKLESLTSTLDSLVKLILHRTSWEPNRQLTIHTTLQESFAAQFWRHSLSDLLEYQLQCLVQHL